MVVRYFREGRVNGTTLAMVGLSAALMSAACRGGADAVAERQRPASPMEASTMKTSTPSETEIVLDVPLKASRAAVFDALTQPGHLLRWLGSTEMDLVGCDVDARAGGSLRLTFRRANGRQLEVRGAIESVESPRRLAYRESYDFSPLQIHVTTTLDETEGATLLRQRLQYASRRERDEDFDGVVASSGEAYTRLGTYLATRRGTQDLSLDKTVRIAAKPAVVWRVLTDVGDIERWLGTRVQTSWRVGDPITFAFTWNGVAFEDKGVLRSVVPAQVLSYSYWSGLSGLADEPQHYSLVTFRLAPDDKGTVLTLRHEMIATEQMQQHSAKNWDDTLATIQSLATAK